MLNLSIWDQEPGISVLEIPKQFQQQSLETNTTTVKKEVYYSFSPSLLSRLGLANKNTEGPVKSILL